MIPSAQVWVKILKKHGVRYVFGIPGGPSLPFLEEIRKQGLEFILVSEEGSAGMMSDVTARLTQIPGICHATFGPGATNLSTGVGCAWLDRSSLIAFTTEVPDPWRDRVTQMNIDHQLLFRPITKWTVRVNKDNMIDSLEEAFEISKEEVPGPVHIGVPSDLTTCQQGKGRRKYPSLNKYPEALSDQIAKAATFLRNSRMPVLVLGRTAARLEIYKAVQRFLDTHSMPVLLTPMAKGLIDRENPHYLGVLFHVLGEKLAPVYRQADLVIGCGYDPIEFNYEQWMPQVPLIHIDTRQAHVLSDIPVVNLIGHPGDAMEVLATEPGLPVNWNWDMIRQARESVWHNLTNSKTFGPLSMLRVLREELPWNGILTVDVGSHTHLVGQLWDTPSVNSLVMTNGWSSMGFGIPAAIAAKLVHPDLPVACLCGDGGFLMKAGEIMVARRLGLHIVLIVLADKQLNLIHVKQRNKSATAYGTQLYKGELFTSNSFLGVKVYKSGSIKTFQRALRDAFSSHGPIIIEAAIDPEEYFHMITKEYK
jgi:acetolactate synthase-1/2/3 large subunit